MEFMEIQLEIASTGSALHNFHKRTGDAAEVAKDP
jgi:hypothetical protein